MIDADKVAHTVYSKTEPGYVSVVNHFGDHILDPTTKEIDRRKLGAIVFSDKVSMVYIHPDNRQVNQGK